ncbi:histidine kinase [Flammeovirgaceae bacterium 311]|nr:histidine kinase [Flammeovirgaceae bacterium 311]
MSIRKRLTWQFTLIVTSILVLFFVFIYIFYADFRREEYYSRLYNKALTTARLLIEVQEIDHDLLKIIDKNALNALHNEKIVIFDQHNQLIYSSTEDHNIRVLPEVLDEIREVHRLEWVENKNESLGITYDEGDKHYVIIASAFDIYGRRKLVNLRFILIAGSLLGMGITFAAGRFFAIQALRPIANINQEVSGIGGHNLDTRIDIGNGQDEIAQLAINFNKMLDRIASAFALQKNFVHNASHELRTPLAAMISQMQVGLAKERNREEYCVLLKSVLEDAERLKGLSNGLLELAQAEADKMGIRMAPVRIDETLFSAQQDLIRLDGERSVEVTFSELPDSEESLTVMANEGMLRTLFLNLMDNACKFSPDRKAIVSIAFNGDQVHLSFKDNGIGIPEAEQEKIFMPFYRAESARKFRGHGLGLSICSRIVQLHGGVISVKSQQEQGSTFRVELPHA